MAHGIPLRGGAVHRPLEGHPGERGGARWAQWQDAEPFGQRLEFDLSKGFPLLTTKRVFCVAS